MNEAVKKDRSKMLLGNEVITVDYLNGIAEEINERLQNIGSMWQNYVSLYFSPLMHSDCVRPPGHPSCGTGIRPLREIHDRPRQVAYGDNHQRADAGDANVSVT